MEESSLRNLVERTGKSLDEWIEIVRRDGPADEKLQFDWLKSEHGFTTNYAKWLVDRAAGRGGSEAYDPDAYVETQYAGKKEALRPIYDKLLQLAFALGNDVKACPGTTIVPLYRKNVFAQIKATTSRVDLGLCLKGVQADERLIDTGGAAKGDRITHRIPIVSVDEIDETVQFWLKRAYEANS